MKNNATLPLKVISIAHHHAHPADLNLDSRRSPAGFLQGVQAAVQGRIGVRIIHRGEIKFVYVCVLICPWYLVWHALYILDTTMLFLAIYTRELGSLLLQHGLCVNIHLIWTSLWYRDVIWEACYVLIIIAGNYS